MSYYILSHPCASKHGLKSETCPMELKNDSVSVLWICWLLIFWADVWMAQTQCHAYTNEIKLHISVIATSYQYSPSTVNTIKLCIYTTPCKWKGSLGYSSYL
jgi:hypothetical protein